MATHAGSDSCDQGGTSRGASTAGRSKWALAAGLPLVPAGQAHRWAGAGERGGGGAALEVPQLSAAAAAGGPSRFRPLAPTTRAGHYPAVVATRLCGASLGRKSVCRAQLRCRDCLSACLGLVRAGCRARTGASPSGSLATGHSRHRSEAAWGGRLRGARAQALACWGLGSLGSGQRRPGAPPGSGPDKRPSAPPAAAGKRAAAAGRCYLASAGAQH